MYDLSFERQNVRTKPRSSKSRFIKIIVALLALAGLAVFNTAFSSSATAAPRPMAPAVSSAVVQTTPAAAALVTSNVLAVSPLAGPILTTNYSPYSCTTHPILQLGSTGSCVKAVQWTNNNERDDFGNLMFAQLVVDGQYGPLTRDAVIRFQRAKGLVQDGIVGPKTYAAYGL